MRKILPVILTVGLLSITAAQTQPTPFPSPDPGRATIYIYKTRHARTLGRLTFPVYLNEQRIANLDGERYFMLRLKPGTYSFRSRNPRQGGVELDAQAGKEYFIRMDTEEGFMVRSPRLSLVPPEQGRYDVRQMKPIDSKDVKVPDVVVIPPDLRQRN